MQKYEPPAKMIPVNAHPVTIDEVDMLKADATSTATVKETPTGATPPHAKTRLLPSDATPTEDLPPNPGRRLSDKDREQRKKARKKARASKRRNRR